MGKNESKLPTETPAAENPTTADAAVPLPCKGRQEVKEPTYTARELSGACARLGKNVTPDLVTAAMVSAGKKTATIEEAKEMVEKFMKKEVK